MRESIRSGALTEAIYYIMLSVMEPLHGYGIMQKIRELSAGRVNLGPGTLYGAINTLIEKCWIISVPGEENARGRKEYQITDDGRCVLQAELERLRELVGNGEVILKGK